LFDEISILAVDDDCMRLDLPDEALRQGNIGQLRSRKQTRITMRRSFRFEFARKANLVARSVEAGART